MTDNPSTTTGETAATQVETPSLADPPLLWGVALFVAAAGAWALLNFTPFLYDLPDRLATVDMYSPPEMQKEAAALSEVHYWKNTVMKMGLVGACFGVVGLIAAVGAFSLRRLIAAVIGLAAGVGCGVLAGYAGIYLRRRFDSGHIVPLLSQDAQPVAIDVTMYVFMSVLAVFSIFLAVLLAGGKQSMEKAIAVLMAGLATGLLVPLVSVALPSAKTHFFPPEGLLLTAIWFVCLAGLTLVFTTITGQKKKVSA